MMRGLRERKHLALLAALVVAAIMEPLSIDWTESARVIGGVTVVVINVGVLLVIFERRWERGLAIFLLAFLFVANTVHEISADRLQLGAVAFHCLGAVFFAFAVAVILKRIFQRKIIRTDDVIGALCGYLLAGVAWGNAYALAYSFWPESFRIAGGIATRLGDWHFQRFVFNYFSIMTLTTLGFSDIAPAGSPVYSLVWLESVFGQFYIAVVVAQLVGLRLAEAIERSRSSLR
jgi:voltage-gated potassium channel